MVRQAPATLVRRRILVVYVFLALVMAVGALTALIALDSAARRSAQTRVANERLAAIDELGAASRELARTARRYVLSARANERLRAETIAGDLSKLATSAGFAETSDLQRELDRYASTVLGLLEIEAASLLEHLAHFEDDLEDARGALDARLDAVAAVARSQRGASPSVATLARRARWAVIAATVLGLVLAAFACLGTLQVLRRGAEAAAANETAMHGRFSLQRDACDSATLVDRAVRHRRDLALERNVRLRYEAALSRDVMVDRSQILHVLSSLLELAILETRPGGCITLHVSAIDNGVRFAAISDSPDATGEHTSDVVLQACRRVVTAHGGTLDVQTDATRTYWFTIPTEPTLLT